MTQSTNPNPPANQASQLIDINRQLHEFERQANLVLDGAYTSLDRPKGSWDRRTMSSKADEFYGTLGSIPWGDKESSKAVFTEFIKHKCGLEWALDTSENIERVTKSLKDANQMTNRLISKYDTWKDRTGNTIRKDVDLKERKTNTEEVINISRARETALEKVYQNLGFIQTYYKTLNSTHELPYEYETWQNNENDDDLRRMVNEIDTAEDQDTD